MYRQDIEVHSDLRKQEVPVQDKYYGCPDLKVREDRQRLSFTERCTGDRYTGVYPECGYGNRLRRFNRAE